jgi:K+-transporting ATPase ATPase A chain
MNIYDWGQVVLYFAVLLALVKPLGAFMARVYQGERTFLDPIIGPAERFIYRLAGINPAEEMGWKRYAKTMLVFNMLGFLAVYALQRVQAFLPLNPAGMAAVSPDSSFNTAMSFVTNTNWQGYAGESTMSYLTQMLGLTVQNFLSAATGMAVLAALIRGFARHSTKGLGNFWADLVRVTLYILIPLSLVFSVALASQGVVQTFSKTKTVTLVQPTKDDKGKALSTQDIAVGPVASQIAIKQLGTNGGGFFNANSAHPFENPNPFTGFLEMLAILLIPASLCYTFGVMAGDRRQGWAVLAAMTIIFVSFLAFELWAEHHPNPMVAKGASASGRAVAGTSAGLSSVAGPPANMEGKEVRFGVTNSALWATATTAASNGSVNSMLDSFMPLGGLAPLLLIHLGEIIYGGVGSGLYGMLVFVIIAVFVAGLMVGRTPEYLGKKVEAFEMKMASLVILIPVFVILAGAAIAVVVPAGVAGASNPGPHGYSEILYAFSSFGGNNGSAFAGINANTPFYNAAGGIVMFFCRFLTAIPILAIAGNLAEKKTVPVSAGTLPTHTPLFIGWLVSVILIVAALSFFPALALGPIVEHLMM